MAARGGNQFHRPPAVLLGGEVVDTASRGNMPDVLVSAKKAFSGKGVCFLRRGSQGRGTPVLRRDFLQNTLVYHRKEDRSDLQSGHRRFKEEGTPGSVMERNHAFQKTLRLREEKRRDGKPSTSEEKKVPSWFVGNPGGEIPLPKGPLRSGGKKRGWPFCEGPYLSAERGSPPNQKKERTLKSAEIGTLRRGSNLGKTGNRPRRARKKDDKTWGKRCLGPYQGKISQGAKKKNLKAFR